MPEPSTEAPDIEHSVTLLERRYRTWLRLLPEDYRRQWADDMVETFLAGALTGDDEAVEIAGYGTPPLAEVASIAALAVRLRLGTTERAPRPLVWREAWRRVALVGLLVNTIWVTVSLPSALWLEGWLPGIAQPAEATQQVVPDKLSFFEVVIGGWWHSYWSLSGLASAAAFLALLHGRRWTATLLAVVALVPALVNEFQFRILDGPAFTSAFVITVAVQVLPVLALLAYIGDPRPIARRPWLWSWAAGVVALVACAVVAWTITPDLLLDPPGFYCVAVTLGGAGYLVVSARRRTAPDPALVLTLAILSVVVLLDRLGVLIEIWFVGNNNDALGQRLMYSGDVEAALAALTALTFGALAGRAVRALPATATD